MKTYQPKASEVKREMHEMDAGGRVLGRFASEVARKLIGKDKRSFAYHVDVGDFVTVINASKVRLTGKKAEDKVYQKHSGYPGGFKSVSVSKLLKENPSKVIQLAVERMLPKNRLRSARMSRLKVYDGEKE